jgi:hypothetical protein
MNRHRSSSLMHNEVMAAPRELSRFEGGSAINSLVFVPNTGEPQALVRRESGWVLWALRTGATETLPFTALTVSFVPSREGWVLLGGEPMQEAHAPALRWPSLEPFNHTLPWAHAYISYVAPLLAVSRDGAQVARIVPPAQRSHERIAISALRDWDPHQTPRHEDVPGPTPGSAINGMAWSADSRYVVCSTSGDSLHAAHLEEATTFNVGQVSVGRPQWVAVHGKTPHAALCSQVVAIVDLDARREVARLEVGSGSTLFGGFTSAGHFVCAADGALLRWDWQAQRLWVHQPLVLPTSPHVWCSPDGEVVIYAGGDSLIALDARGLHEAEGTTVEQSRTTTGQEP